MAGESWEHTIFSGLTSQPHKWQPKLNRSQSDVPVIEKKKKVLSPYLFTLVQTAEPVPNFVGHVEAESGLGRSRTLCTSATPTCENCQSTALLTSLQVLLARTKVLSDHESLVKQISLGTCLNHPYPGSWAGRAGKRSRGGGFSPLPPLTQLPPTTSKTTRGTFYQFLSIHTESSNSRF